MGLQKSGMQVSTHTQDMQTPRSPQRSLSRGLALGDSTCTRCVLAGSGPWLGLALGPEPLMYSGLPANRPRAQRRPQLQVQGLFLHVVRFLPATQAVGPERLSLHPLLFRRLQLTCLPAQLERGGPRRRGGIQMHLSLNLGV